MAAGKEIKRLREAQERKISVAKAASLIGVDPERLRKWELRDSDPTDLEDAHRIEQYFGVALHDLKTLDSFQFRRQGSLKLDTNIRMSNQPLPSEIIHGGQYADTLRLHSALLQRLYEEKITAIEEHLKMILDNQEKMAKQIASLLHAKHSRV